MVKTAHHSSEAEQLRKRNHELSILNSIAQALNRSLDLDEALNNALAQVAEHRDNPAAAFRGKQAALRALARLGDPDALPILQRVAANEVDGRIVRLARLCAALQCKLQDILVLEPPDDQSV